MEVQKYDVRYFEQDLFVEKYWDPTNTPVVGPHNRMSILHTVVDITVAMKMHQATLQMTGRSDYKKTSFRNGKRKFGYDAFLWPPSPGTLY